jgi:dihydroxyacetone kinase-like predicted kinase
MERALASVRSAEVTRAVRATIIDGRRIAMGQAIGIVDGKLTVVTDDVASAARGCLEHMLGPEASLLTLYSGRDVRDEDAEALVAELRPRYPDLEIDLVRGDQPHYPYLLSLE